MTNTSSRVLSYLCIGTLVGASAFANEESKAKAPNIMLIVVDDMGYSDLPVFGSEIRTPNIQNLADRGSVFNNFHTSSFSAPTRAMLLTGVDNHHAGFGNMSDFQSNNQYGNENYLGYFNKKVTPLPLLMRQNGYATFMVGKWHLGELPQQWPDKKGFDRSYALVNGGISHFADARAMAENQKHSAFYVEDGVKVPQLPADFYSSTYYTDKAIEFISETAEDKPVFAYIAFTAPHDPLHIIDSWADKYKGVYDGGYDAIKKSRLARQKELGIVPKDTPANAGMAKYPRWHELSEDQKKRETRQMEIYAAMVEYMDYSLGRIVEELKKTGRYENTIFIFMSDNGASKIRPEEYPGSSVEYVQANFDNSLENMGRPNSSVSMGPAWAETASTPFSYFKGLSYEGGIRSPLIIAGAGFDKQGGVDNRLLHVTDIYSTIADSAGITLPKTGGDTGLAPYYGESILSNPARDANDVLHFEVVEKRAIFLGNWKAVYTSPQQGWELYDLSEDMREQNNLAAQQPEIIKRVEQEWEKYSKQVGYIPSDGSLAGERVGYDKVNKFIPAE